MGKVIHVDFATGRTLREIVRADEKAAAVSAPTFVPAYCDPKNEYRGEKYARRDIAEIGSLVRADIVAARVEKRLPWEMKTSVRISRFSGGSSLYVRITALPGSEILNRAWVEHEQTCQREHRYERNPHKRYAPEIEAALATLKGIVMAYKRDNSDISVDYFDVNFYEHVEVDHDLERAAQQKILNR